MQGYIASYNMPVSQSIFNILNYQKQSYSYDNDPRGIIYARYDKLISNVEDMKKWLIMN